MFFYFHEQMNRIFSLALDENTIAQYAVAYPDTIYFQLNPI